MLVLERDISANLLAWKGDPRRKVLLLRGARQVGKTFIVRALAKEFSSFVEVNFYERPELGAFFKGGNFAPQLIVEKLEAYFGSTITPGETLLFFDEIQACPDAISSLRFFYEKMRELHVIAAGSLLEFALAQLPSFGVGRISSLFMYPVSCREFFRAAGEERLSLAITKATPRKPLDEVLHKRAVELLRSYLLIGGLPEVVSTYLETRKILLCLELLEALIQGYEDDFSNYKERVDVPRLREVFRAAAKQAGRKFIFAEIKLGQSTHGYSQCLEQLRLAGLVYKVCRVSANGIPLGAEVNPKHFKILPFDLGVSNRLIGLQASETILPDKVALVNSGSLAEIFCGLELIANSKLTQRPELFYWSREARGSNAEVDYIVQIKNELYPIEVKAGTKGQMQSMYRFLEEKQKIEGIRTSLENFSQFKSPDGKKTVKVVPLYSIGRVLREAP